MILLHVYCDFNYLADIFPRSPSAKGGFPET